MNDGEWTEKDVAEIVATRKELSPMQAIADAHNTMSDQPKPTCDWTPEYVDNLLGQIIATGVVKVADAHNAAIAAAEERWEQCAMFLHEQERVSDQLREQLAERHKLCVDYETKWKAEREKSRILGNMTDGFRDQLAAERELVKDWQRIAQDALAKVKEGKK